MAQPFDYSLNVPTPLEAGAQAFKLGAGIAAAEEQARAYQQNRQMAALQQQQAMEQEMAEREAMNAAADPNATPQQILRAQLFTKNKEQIEALANWGRTLDVERAKPMVNRLLMVAGPLAHNNPKIAIANLEREFAANEGNPKAQAEIRSRIDEIGANPAAAASRSMAELSLLPGGEQAVSNLLKLTAEQRAQSKADYEAREGVAKATKAEVDAQFARQQAEAQLSQAAAQLGLTRAQANEANARSRNLGIEGKKAVLELQAMELGGGVDPTKLQDIESKFRNEYNTQTKQYQAVKASYSRLLAAEDTGVGDIALIYGYMKMQDPESVVREGEYATAENSGGVSDKVRNLYNKAVSGERLNPKQRQMFLSQANNLYKSAKQQESVVRSGIERIAKGYGLKTSNIFYSETEEPPEAVVKQATKPQAAQGQPPGMPPVQTQPGAVTVRTPDGKTLAFPNQQAADRFKRSAGL